MATVTSFTAERMLEIENTTIVDGEVQGDNLILLTREGTEIDAGSVRGPVGPVGPPNDVEAVGVMKMWAATAASMPPKYLPCDGTTRLIADFPDLASLLGTLWGPVTGTTFTLPNLVDYFPKGGATPGQTGGFADATLPAHDHTQPTHTHVGAAHTHTINHNHASSTSSWFSTHRHGIPTNYQVWAWNTTSGEGWSVPGGYGATGNAIPAAFYDDGGHNHIVDIPQHNGSSGPASATTTSAAGNENTGSSGVSPIGRNIPPFKVVPFMIRAIP